MNFFTRHHRKIIFAVAAFCIAYLVLHFAPEWDQFQGITTIGGWLRELGEHIWHIAPVLIVFFIFAAIEIKNRLKSRKHKKSESDSA